MYEFTFEAFHHMTPDTLYALLKLRTDIFVVEQNCAYPELDDQDQQATHLIVRDDSDRIVGCLRMYDHPEKGTAIGRVAVHRSHRSVGLARQMMQRAMTHLQAESAIYLQAQAHLEGFYGSFGFQTVSEPYLEDDIPHVDMQFHVNDLKKDFTSSLDEPMNK
ncbi:GNAT family N-acetyltransferase [Exiguobacterium acetylicum]|uniref:GNAT family N-acetyltransferase n=1 Tax=Exiguobacterium acetylicum TaxID=41170 RepID=UPI001EE2415A|nr:GNAT family N-acetyltransferase [Exiguobacterium acetylicum]UKS56633.1 GNAT family N-acetyltransferase [Exiguobacterium acetylicum]